MYNIALARLKDIAVLLKDKSVTPDDVEDLIYKTNRATMSVTATTSDRDACIELLGELMSAISERCWAAGWIMWMGKSMPSIVKDMIANNADSYWGAGLITLEEAKLMNDLADYIGGWIDYNIHRDDYNLSPYIVISND